MFSLSWLCCSCNIGSHLARIRVRKICTISGFPDLSELLTGPLHCHEPCGICPNWALKYYSAGAKYNQVPTQCMVSIYTAFPDVASVEIGDWHVLTLLIWSTQTLTWTHVREYFLATILSRRPMRSTMVNVFCVGFMAKWPYEMHGFVELAKITNSAWRYT